jgi:hypothetical protein
VFSFLGECERPETAIETMEYSRSTSTRLPLFANSKPVPPTLENLMTDIALARKDACLSVVHAVLSNLIDDADLIGAALRVADYFVDDLEGKITETDAVLLAVDSLSRVNRAMREWYDVDGNPMDAMRVADFIIDEQINGYDNATLPHTTTSPAERMEARAAAVIRPTGSPLRPVHH